MLLVESLGKDSKNWSDHIKRSVALCSLSQRVKLIILLIYRQIASVTLSFSYSLPPLEVDDPLIQRVSAFDRGIEEAARPGAYLVEIFPWMNHLPLWMCKWKRDGMAWHERYSDMFLEFYRDAKRRAVSLFS